MNTPSLAGAKVLLVDDNPANLKVLRQTLETEGYNISVATTGEGALKLVARAVPDLVLLDVMMPGMGGYETCRRLQQVAEVQEIPVIFITARGETEGIVEGFRAGGVDYIAKPFQVEEVLIRIKTHLERAFLARNLVEKNSELAQNNSALQEEINRRKTLTEQLSLISRREAERWGIEGFIGKSRMLQQVLKEIALLQQHGATAVLITGESGTGKELVARAIHQGSARAAGPFVPVNGAAIPGDLAEATLFGHVRGAFTGADADRKGCFELAHQGTLFLDEIGDMPLELQAKLLRVLEDGVVTPVGGSEGRRVDVRVVGATNADLQARIADHTFRQDLYFRLARFVVVVPPLRQRREDIPLLAGHFLGMFAAADLPLNLAQAEKVLVKRALEQTRGNIAAAARLLGTNRPHIYRVLEKEKEES